MFYSLPRRGRRAFTIVELLVAITIIGMLMTIMTVAVAKVIRNAKDTAVIFEVGELAAALQAYKEKYSEYPPCMGATATSTAPTFVGNDRQTRIIKHFRAAFPRYNPPAYATLTNSANVGAYRYVVTNPANGALTAGALNLNLLESAEALVFWLGGFPTARNGTATTSAPYMSRKIMGFHINPANPVALEVGSSPTVNPAAYDPRYRTPPLFDFAESRLVDQDNDGWWEYIPRGMGGANSNGYIPPFVYYDATQYNILDGRTYTMPFTCYPTDNVLLQNSFGLAGPIARIDTPTNTITDAQVNAIVRLQWANPSSFQIICAGQDGFYSTIPANTFGTTLQNSAGANFSIPVFPSGKSFRGTNFNAAATPYDTATQDNLTNFYESTIADAGGGL